VIPLYNEEESVGELTDWICRVLKARGLAFEIIIVDDGSTDSSWDKIKNIQTTTPEIRAIRFRRNYGKSAALNTGFNAVRGDVVVTLDADLQDSPDELPQLYDMIKKEGFDMVSGWKKKRHDPISKTIPSKFFNWMTQKLSGIKLHDFNSGIKAYNAEVTKSIEVYGEMHRYIPVIAKSAGFGNISEKVVTHYPRKFGKTKYGLERIMRGFLDLLSITFIGKFGKRPMHFFGSMGTVLSLCGFIMLLYLTIEKIFYETPGIASRPLFYLGILLIIVGVQLFIAGFLAELIIRNSPGRNDYGIAETI
ncbi:MAG: glycosyltransferase family 2 protein, partial [Saprospiraceae bacterium]|nr:glycosyltransferase family 2 protein [Saprospiraceae bacterium]